MAEFNQTEAIVDSDLYFIERAQNAMASKLTEWNGTANVEFFTKLMTNVWGYAYAKMDPEERETIMKYMNRVVDEMKAYATNKETGKYGEGGWPEYAIEVNEDRLAFEEERYSKAHSLEEDSAKHL